MLYIFKHGYVGISANVGFPIRTSPDQRLVATSPKLIAGSDVLHRSLVSRHPPYALCVLTFRRDPDVAHSASRDADICLRRSSAHNSFLLAHVKYAL